jgi:hypothetical protein
MSLLFVFLITKVTIKLLMLSHIIFFFLAAAPRGQPGVADSQILLPRSLHCTALHCLHCTACTALHSLHYTAPVREHPAFWESRSFPGIPKFEAGGSLELSRNGFFSLLILASLYMSQFAIIIHRHVGLPCKSA